MTATDIDLAELGRTILEMDQEARDAYFDAIVDVDEAELVEAAITAAELEGADWRANPATMAHHLTRGQYRLWRYTKLLGEKFADAVEGRSTRQIWLLPRRYGKPVHVDALVLMGDGSRRRLGEIEPGDSVITHLGRARRVLAVHEQGELPAVTIRTRNGRTTTAALDHPFLTAGGWVEAVKLRPGRDVLAVVPRPTLQTTERRRPEEYRMAGYFIGDGSVGRGRTGALACQMTCFDPIEEADIRACVEALGWALGNDKRPGRLSIKAGRGGRDAGPRPWLESTGIGGHLSWTKRVPEWVMRSDPDDIAGFVGAYFACDGTVAGGPTGRAVEFYSVSEGLLRDVQHLLLRLGIASSLNGKNGLYAGQVHRSWRLRLTGRDATARFVEQVRPHSVKAARLAELDMTRQTFDAPFLPDPVAAVEHVGTVRCRCLTVEDDHTFTADDLVVHNSLMASQWGPTWALDRYPQLKLLLASYGDQLAVENAIGIRDKLLLHQRELRTKLRPDRRQAGRFVTTEGGSVLARGIGSSIVGFGADGAVFDDPYKNWQEAHSPARRELVLNAFRSVVYGTLETENAFVIIPMCLTGDTPVLRPDGTETPIRDIRPGDLVATYEHCGLTAARIKNWASQGYDTTYEVRMKSGRRVRGNARHPFRVINESGEATWVRLASLRAGMRVRSAEAPIRVSSAAPRDARAQPNAKACACLTTARPAGQRAIGHLLLPTRHAELSGSKAATGSRWTSTPVFSKSRTAGALSAGNGQMKSADLSTGPRFSPSTTTTTREPCEACCATTATWSSPERTPSRPSRRRLDTWRIGVDEVVEVVQTGTEEVFDVEVERTHNFIANGLEVSNTCWHESDISQHLMKMMEEDSEAERWEMVRLAEIAEAPNPLDSKPWLRLPDPLGREPGEVIEPERFSPAAVKRKHKGIGSSYFVAAMYQQRPAPEEGGEVKRGWFRAEDSFPPHYDQAISSWDMKLKDKETGDYVVGQCWGRTGKDMWLFDQFRGQWNQATTRVAIALCQVRYPNIRQHYIENSGYGPEVMTALRNAQPGYEVSDDIAGQLGISEQEREKVNRLLQRGINGILPVTPKGPKPVRMRAVSGYIEAGDVHVPEWESWLGIYLDEMAAFPNGSHDDQVDATSQALSKLVGAKASVTRAAGTLPKPTIDSRGAGTMSVTSARSPRVGRSASVRSAAKVIVPRQVPKSGR